MSTEVYLRRRIEPSFLLTGTRFAVVGERLIKLVEESKRLEAGAAEKIEQAARLMSGDRAKKGLTLIASSIRKTIETNDLMREQMLLASDEQIKNQRFSMRSLWT